METSSSSSAAADSLVQALTYRGWCFKDADQIKLLISDQLSSRVPCTVDSIESEFINLDLRAIGGKSLPDPHRLRQVSHLQGPKVLQISSARDISRSSTEEPSGTSGKRRLLRLVLSDRNSELVAIEYPHLRSVPEDVIPGSKIRLETKAVVRNGIVCLNEKAITFMGGVVQTLFEEWQMNKKYSGFSRPSLQTSDETASGCPPPFAKLHIGASLQRQTRSAQSTTTSSLNSSSHPAGISESNSSRQISVSQSQDGKADSRKTSDHLPALTEISKTSETRQKEAVESVPIQNQAAAQKLLQRMNQPNRNNQAFRGRRDRGKGREEESAVLTLDEWERKKATTSATTTRDFPNISRDEDLARQLQEQFALEDSYDQEGFPVTEADNIRMSMFDYHRDEANDRGQTGFRGRGRGRRGGGRGRGRGRGRG